MDTSPQEPAEDQNTPIPKMRLLPPFGSNFMARDPQNMIFSDDEARYSSSDGDSEVPETETRQTSLLPGIDNFSPNLVLDRTFPSRRSVTMRIRSRFCSDSPLVCQR